MTVQNPHPLILRPSLHTALVAVILSSAVASPLVAAAQPAHATRHPGAWRKNETIDQRIASLHDRLKITPEQESNWAAVAQVMRDNDSEMQSMIAARKDIAPDSVSAVEDLKTYERFSQARVSGLKTLISAFETLYTAMPADQQKVADHVFKRFGAHAETAKS